MKQTNLSERPKSLSETDGAWESLHHRDSALTPISFRDKYFGGFIDDCVSLINAPTDDKPYDKLYTVKYLGAVRAA